MTETTEKKETVVKDEQKEYIYIEFVKGKNTKFVFTDGITAKMTNAVALKFRLKYRHAVTARRLKHGNKARIAIEESRAKAKKAEKEALKNEQSPEQAKRTKSNKKQIRNK